MGRVDHAVDARGLGGSEQGAEVLRVLERIEHENERRLLALDGSGEDVVQAGELALVCHEGDALMTVETGEGCKGAPFHLHYRDAQVGCMEDKLLQSLTTLGHNEESDRLASGDERLLDGVAAGNEFLVLTQKHCRWRVELPGPGGRHGDGRPRRWALIAARTGSIVRPGRPLYEWRLMGDGRDFLDWLRVGDRLGVGGRPQAPPPVPSGDQSIGFDQDAYTPQPVDFDATDGVQSTADPESISDPEPIEEIAPVTHQAPFVQRPSRPDYRARSGGYQGPTTRPAVPVPASWARQLNPPPAVLLCEDEELIAGRHPVEEAFIARRKAIRLLVVPQRRQALEKLVLHATNLRIPIVEVEGGTLTSLAGFDGHQGIALVTDKRQFAGLNDILARAIERKEAPFVLVLDSLEDPQNFGALLRTAEASGVHGVIYPTHRQAPLSAAAVKASAGAVEHLLLVPVDDLAEALTDLHIRGLRVIGSDAEAPLTARQSDLRGPVVIVVGR